MANLTRPFTGERAPRTVPRWELILYLLLAPTVALLYVFVMPWLADLAYQVFR